MKRVISLIHAAVIISAIPFIAKAQEQYKMVSAGAELMVPAHGNNGLYKTPGYGAGVAVSFPVGSYGSITGRASYLRLDKKKVEGFDNFFPVQAGYRFSPSGQNIYLHGEGGVILLSDRGGIKQTNFILTGGPGYMLPVANGFVDFSLKYSIEFFSGSTFGWTGVRVAYAFQFEQ
ncbi:MAG: hypothetical protein HC867_01230 [Bacteroidia bacterium]|nr:hypothetical protein [Bacteroidia bacterium]